MRELISVQTAAQKWNITPRRVQILCNDGRIEGAVKESGIWLIPAVAPKPARQTKLSKNAVRKIKHQCSIAVFRVWRNGFGNRRRL